MSYPQTLHHLADALAALQLAYEVTDDGRLAQAGADPGGGPDRLGDPVIWLT